MSDFPKDAPSIRDAKPRKKTNVKHYPGLGIAPTIKEGKKGPCPKTGEKVCRCDDKKQQDEGFKPFPTSKVTRKIQSLDTEKKLGLDGDTREQKAKHAKRRMKMDMAVYVDKDPELRSMHRSAKQTIEKENRERGRKRMEEMIDDLFGDPLAELWDLAEELNVQPKPQLNTDFSAAYEGPNAGDIDHPVARKRQALDAEMEQGNDPIESHQSVHGEVDLGDTTSKRQLAGTLGRIQDERSKNGIRIEPEKGSLLARDAEIEMKMDQTTHDDLRTPIRGQVPDRLQTPADEVAEEVNTGVEYDYNEDVAYLQKFGRA